jgi:phosphatidylglycerol:prolipoprotein diacylglycerol transferase
VWQTPCHIRPEIWGIPVVGVGWLLFAWLVCAAVVTLAQYRAHGWGAETKSQLLVSIVVACVIVFVLPRIEEHVPGPEAGSTINQGIPIRGYGVMVLLGVASGVGLAVWRASRVGIESEVIFGLAFAMFIGGVVGARLFYVIQYWDQLQDRTLAGTAANIVNVVGGGLVVYGSIFGAAVGYVYFVSRHGLPYLKLADLIAPSLALGLSFGRMGCLLNGCCFGGLTHHAWAVSFPDNAPPYQHQKSLGLLHGIRLGDSPQGVVIQEIVSRDAARDANLSRGDQIDAINGQRVSSLQDARAALANSGRQLVLETSSGRTVRLSLPELPSRSLRIHPTQIYASMNALLLCLLAITWYPYRSRDGQVITGMMILYAATRFLLEELRDDEIGRFGTNLTISQIISVLLGILLVGIWFYLQRRPRLA